MRQDDTRKQLSGLGWFFLITIIVHVAFSIAFSLLAQKGFTFPVEVSLVVSELTILVPAFIYVLIKNLGFTKDIGFTPIKAGTFLMCVLLSVIITPISSFVNVLSQFFVPNTMVAASDYLAAGSSPAVLFLGAIYGPLCEEFVFRGVLNNRYDKYIGPIRAGLVSSLFFALAHLNINQAAYTFVLGFILAVVNKAAGSIFASVTIHACINGGNIALLLMMTKAAKSLGGDVDLVSSAEAVRGSDIMYYMLAVTMMAAIVCTLLAIPCIAFIAKNEGRYDLLCDMFTKKGPKVRWITVSSALAIAFALFVMFGIGPVLRIIGG